MNLYTYALNNALSFVDPLGLLPEHRPDDEAYSKYMGYMGGSAPQSEGDSGGDLIAPANPGNEGGSGKPGGDTGSSSSSRSGRMGMSYGSTTSETERYIVSHRLDQEGETIRISPRERWFENQPATREFLDAHRDPSYHPRLWQGILQPNDPRQWAKDNNLPAREQRLQNIENQQRNSIPPAGPTFNDAIQNPSILKNDPAWRSTFWGRTTA